MHIKHDYDQDITKIIMMYGQYNKIVDFYFTVIYKMLFVYLSINSNYIDDLLIKSSQDLFPKF